jgi:hypothetical protein
VVALVDMTIHTVEWQLVEIQFLQCSRGLRGYDNSYSAVAALVDMTIYTVQWWLLWI